MHIPTIERRESSAAPWSPPTGTSTSLAPNIAPLAGLVVTGTVLTMITLGIYRFWYRSRLRRHYWANTRLLGDGFEYTGTGKELLIGFLIALAIIVPINLGLTFLGLQAGESVGAIIGYGAASLIIPGLIQIAIFRARRYRLSRTRYRGVRFAQSGSALKYLWISVKYLLLTLITLGIAMPYLRTALNRYRIENTWFGMQQASFEGTAKPLMKYWMLVWGVGVLTLLVMIAAPIAIGFKYKSQGAMIGVAVVIAALLLTLLVLWQVYKAAEFRSFTGATRFGTMSLSSDLKASSVIWTMVKYLFAVLGSVLVLMATMALVTGIIAGILAYGVGMDVSSLMESEGMNVLIGILAGLGIFIPIAVVTELMLRRKLWALSIASISITNTDALQEIMQNAGIEGGAFGDAFDTGFEIAG